MCLFRCRVVNQLFTYSSFQSLMQKVWERATYEEEHDCTGVVQFVHCVEIWDAIDVAHVDDGKVLYLLSDLVEHFILAHACFIVVSSEADDHETFIFGEYSLVDVPAGLEVRKYNGTHGDESVLCDGVLVEKRDVTLSQVRAALDTPVRCLEISKYLGTYPGLE